MTLTTSPFTPQFDERVQSELRRWNVPGLAAAVIHGSHTFTKAYGIAKFPDKPMNNKSLFSACSTTKAFTAAAVALTIEESKLSPTPINWDTPLSSLIRDDFVLADEYATVHTTLEDALSHRSGFPAHWGAMRWANKNETLRDAVRKMRHLPLAFQPRTTFSYCNHMYMAVSYALEQTTGQDLGSLLTEKLWVPLGMHDTYFNVQDVKNSPSIELRLVRGYTWDAKTNSHVPEPYMDYTAATGCGAIVSSVEDYALWTRSMFARSRNLNDPLLHPRTIIPAVEDGLRPLAPFNLYALGWYVENFHGEQLYWHNGAWPGFGIMVGFLPEREFGFVFMGNSMDAQYAAVSLYMYLLETILGVSSTVGLGNRTQNPRVRTEEEAKQELYPELASSPLPHSLPLERYISTYTHPGYGSFKLCLARDDSLRLCLGADLSDRVISTRLVLKHVSGEFFLGKLFTGVGGASVEFFRGEFCVDCSAKVRRVGLDLEPALKGEMIWFQRNSV